MRQEDVSLNLFIPHHRYDEHMLWEARLIEFSSLEEAKHVHEQLTKHIELLESLKREESARVNTHLDLAHEDGYL